MKTIVSTSFSQTVKHLRSFSVPQTNGVGWGIQFLGTVYNGNEQITDCDHPTEASGDFERAAWDVILSSSLLLVEVTSPCSHKAAFREFTATEWEIHCKSCVCVTRHVHMSIKYVYGPNLGLQLSASEPDLKFGGRDRSIWVWFWKNVLNRVESEKRTSKSNSSNLWIKYSIVIKGYEF